MTTKTITSKIKKLENRVKELECLLRGGRRTQGDGSHTMRKLNDRLEQSRLHQQKRVREILARTYGSMTKKRADEISKHIKEARV